MIIFNKKHNITARQKCFCKQKLHKGLFRDLRKMVSTGLSKKKVKFALFFKGNIWRNSKKIVKLMMKRINASNFIIPPLPWSFSINQVSALVNFYLYPVRFVGARRFDCIRKCSAPPILGMWK